MTTQNQPAPVDAHLVPQPALVLVADDDPIHRTMFSAALERAGHAVVTADSGVAALQLAEFHRPDVLLIDAVMPGLDGFGAIAAIRQRPGLEATPTIVLSGLEDTGSRVRALAIGADDFLAKPIEPAELVARVRAHLRSADVWSDKVTGAISDLRSMRRTIADHQAAQTPTELIEKLATSLPDRLGCSTLVVLDDDGTTTWVDAATDLSSVRDEIVFPPVADSAATAVVPRAVPSAICPVCARPGGGSVLLADIGSWPGGRALLVVGCLDRGQRDRRAIADEVADAYRAAIRTRLRDRAELDVVRWLRDVIDRQAFDVHVQRIVDISSARLVAVEALARFDDGTPPGVVFGAAQQHDLTTELELALVAMAIERTAGHAGDVALHVNVSPDAAVTPRLQQIIGRTRRPIVLEITEHALFSAESAAALRDALPPSCQLAADDVGVGYAGLSQLLEYRPEIVKIDRSLVAGIDADPARQALVAGLVRFAQVTGSRTIGEGIEEAEEWLTLRDLGVELGQGYYFGRPEPIRPRGAGRADGSKLAPRFVGSTGR